MTMHPFINAFLRERRLLKRRPWDFAMISWVPFLMAMLLYWIFSTNLARDLPVAIWDDDRTSTSQQIVRMLDAAPSLKVSQFVLNEKENEIALKGVNVYAVFYIPRDTEKNIKQGKPANVVLLNNAQFANSSSLIDAAAQGVIGTLSAGIQQQSLAAFGISQVALNNTIQPIGTNAFPLFNVSVNYEQFLGISLIVAVLYILAMTAGAWSVGREIRDKTLDQWLQNSRISSIFLALAGKLFISWFFLSLVGVCFLVYTTVGNGWFILGSLPWVCIAFCILMGLSLVIGSTLASVTLSLRTALSGAGFISAPSFAFSGAAFPLISMMPSAKTWALLMPFTHYENLQIGQTSAGAPISQTSDVAVYMVIASFTIALISSCALKRALNHPEKWGGR